jgi:hypothetical protein
LLIASQKLKVKICSQKIHEMFQVFHVLVLSETLRELSCSVPSTGGPSSSRPVGSRQPGATAPGPRWEDRDLVAAASMMKGDASAHGPGTFARKKCGNMGNQLGDREITLDNSQQNQ